uniref:Alpha-(1,6)-fucosyltransferase N- and catalytic domain-containing protein n=1 Tax=Tetradesmus obliquus TaxID=3088 RepID=A0A383W9G6_TETOB|eukprot:jgi/Sobl393_1/13017/SZX74285.1
MAHYRALQRPPAHSWLLLLAGVLIGITLSSLLHQNRWQSEHQPGVADLRKARTPQIKDDGGSRYMLQQQQQQQQQQQASRADVLRDACRVPPLWRTHHIFSSTVTDPCPQQLVQGSWMNAAKENGVGGVLPYTAQAQQAIWQHQHPQDCSKAKFLVLSDPPGGIGSVFHSFTVALGAALETGRILVKHEDWLADSDYCGAQNTLDSCYFEPISSCKLSKSELLSASNATDGANLTTLADARVLQVKSMQVMVDMRLTVPKQFVELLQNTGIPSRSLHYWWRSQGVAYLVRPNARTLAEMQRRQARRFRGSQLAPGCISLYIRHGDKWDESPVFSDAEYEAVTKRLRQTDPALTNQLFLSTEDPVTIQYYSNTTNSSAAASWRTSYTELENDSYDGIDYGLSAEVIKCLLNLDLAMQCDGYVASVYSNWARLIDELRSTVRCKANALYFDAHYTSPADVDFNW